MTSTCVSTDTIPPIEGVACQPFEARNITASKPEFCSLACVQDQRCEATIYDIIQGFCLLMNNPCFSLEPRSNHVYRSFKHECTKWVPSDGSYPAYWFFEFNPQRSYVSRKAHQGNIIIGKKTNRFYAVNPIDNHMVDGGSYELLMVEPNCNVTWVSHDSTSGQPLPRGALIGGVLADTNTPLYVARISYEGGLLAGFYNPLNGMAWSIYSGAKNSTLLEIMIVNLEGLPWTLRLYYFHSIQTTPTMHLLNVCLAPPEAALVFSPCGTANDAELTMGMSKSQTQR